mmetsp:Transcript_7134/g.19176  ORF Transcript_7134/g.19176 Transcript_7134/m.19176 type:complete len:235 (+) Transcript_7134:4053-4757(+)
MSESWWAMTLWQHHLRPWSSSCTPTSTLCMKQEASGARQMQMAWCSCPPRCPSRAPAWMRGEHTCWTMGASCCCGSGACWTGHGGWRCLALTCKPPILPSPWTWSLPARNPRCPCASTQCWLRCARQASTTSSALWSARDLRSSCTWRSTLWRTEGLECTAMQTGCCSSTRLCCPSDLGLGAACKGSAWGSDRCGGQAEMASWYAQLHCSHGYGCNQAHHECDQRTGAWLFQAT